MSISISHPINGGHHRIVRASINCNGWHVHLFAVCYHYLASINCCTSQHNTLSTTIYLFCLYLGRYTSLYVTAVLTMLGWRDMMESRESRVHAQGVKRVHLIDEGWSSDYGYHGLQLSCIWSWPARRMGPYAIAISRSPWRHIDIDTLIIMYYTW